MQQSSASVNQKNNQSVKTNNPEKQEKQSQILKTENVLTEQTSSTLQLADFIGPKEKMGSICQQQQKKWLISIHLCRRLFTMNNPLTI